MLKFMCWITAACSAFCAGPVAAQGRAFNIPLIDNTYQAYVQYLDGRNPLDLSAVRKEGLTRHIMEILVFQNAIALSGCQMTVKYEPYGADSTNARALIDMRDGRLLAVPVAGFKADSRTQEVTYISDPILGDDEFKVGIFTHESRKDILSIRDPAAVRKLLFVAVETWEVDRRVLKEKNLRYITAVNWSSALQMVAAGRADALLQPFSNRADFSFDEPLLNLKFLPIPGFKMNFGAGRYYSVSKKHPDGKLFYGCLSKGLSILKSSGKLQELQVAAGQIDPRVRVMENIP